MGFVQLSVTLTTLSVLWSGIAQADINRELFGRYQKILEQYLAEKDLPNDGLVSAFDYASAIHDDNTAKILAGQRESLAEFDLSSLEGREVSIAFWINAYNFFMLDQILTERPDGELVSSVWDYGGRVNPFVDSVFEEDFREASGSRKAFIVKWADSSVVDRVAETSEIKFIDYNWALNKPANFPEFR